MSRWLLSALCAALGFVAHPLAAQSVEDFYKGKTITYFIGFTPGGSYDLYARLLSEFMPRHIPGHPQMIVQNRPGASSLNAAQHVYNVAAHDGLTIGMNGNLLPLDQLMAGKRAKVDFSKVRYLGNLVELTSTMIVWHTAPAQTLQDLKSKEVIFGSTGPSGETYIVPVVANHLLGTKIKVVTGYPGITEVMIALERGEVQGRSGSWQNVTQRPQWIAQKLITPLVQVGVTKHRDLPNVPMFSELVKNEDDKRIVELVSNLLAISRAPWVAPKVPEERVKALRAAFEATVKDPQFLKIAKARNVDIIPMSGAEVEKRLRTSLDVPAASIDRLRKMLDTKG